LRGRGGCFFLEFEKEGGEGERAPAKKKKIKKKIFYAQIFFSVQKLLFFFLV
jgi:hypothetical protein